MTDQQRFYLERQIGRSLKWHEMATADRMLKKGEPITYVVQALFLFSGE